MHTRNKTKEITKHTYTSQGLQALCPKHGQHDRLVFQTRISKVHLLGDVKKPKETASFNYVLHIDLNPQVSHVKWSHHWNHPNDNDETEIKLLIEIPKVKQVFNI